MDSGMVRLFEDSGLSEKESRVYLALLELGQASVSRVADAAKLKRSITYVTLESLNEKGYASIVGGKKIAIYAAGDPTMLSARLSTTARHFAEVLPYGHISQFPWSRQD